MARHLPARRTVKNGLKTVETDRDARGRFLPGNPGGGRPANPFGRYQRELRGAVLTAVTLADLQSVIKQVVRLAKRGHGPSVELLLKWTLGGPPPALDPDKLDTHEREVRTGRLTMLDHLAQAEDPPAGEQADREPAEADEEESEDPRDSTAPPLRTVLAWALEELAQAQSALRTQPPPPDPRAGWERFAEHHLEFDSQAAGDVDQLYLSYARWAAGHGEPVLAEAQILAWLGDKGVEVRTGALSQVTTVVGVRVVA